MLAQTLGVLVQLGPGIEAPADATHIWRNWWRCDAASVPAGAVVVPDPEIEPALAPPDGPDPLWSRQWGLHVLGAADLWERPAERPAPTVGVIDSGVARHADLLAAARSYSIEGLADPPDADWCRHGTHVAGIAAAISGNGVGITGVAPSDVSSVKVLQFCWGTVSMMAEGLAWSAQEGHRVVNLSLQARATNEMMDEAVAMAAERGVIMVAAAGNWSEAEPAWPARYPEVIAVGAIERSGLLASFSNRRPDFVAPGVDILSTYPAAPGYRSLSGTSMASPHVAGVIARMLAERDLTADQVRWALRYTAADLGTPGWDALYGWGLVQAGAAVELVRADRSDVNHDGACDLFDLHEFMNLYDLGDFRADLTLDGAVTLDDLLQFQHELDH